MEGHGTVGLPRASAPSSIYLKSYKVSDALGTEAGLLRPTQEAHISGSLYMNL